MICSCYKSGHWPQCRRRTFSRRSWRRLERSRWCDQKWKTPSSQICTMRRSSEGAIPAGFCDCRDDTLLRTHQPLALQRPTYHHTANTQHSSVNITSLPGPIGYSARGRFLLPSPVHGTGCQHNSIWCVPRQFSNVPWKRSCSRLPTVSN